MKRQQVDMFYMHTAYVSVELSALKQFLSKLLTVIIHFLHCKTVERLYMKSLLTVRSA